MFRRTFWRIGFLESLSFFFVSRFRAKIFKILTRNFRQFGHNCILHAMWSFFFNSWRREKKENLFFFETFASLSLSDFKQKRYLVLLQAWLRQACQKFVVHVQTKIFANKFFGRLINFSSFPEIQQKFFRVLTTKFRQGGHNCFILVHRNIFRKVNFLSICSKFFFVVFGIWAENLWILRENCLLPLSKMHSPLLKNRFWWKKKVCSKNCNFNNFGVWESLSYSWHQSYGRLAKNSLCMFRRTSWGKIILFGRGTYISLFTEFEQKFFRVLTRIFRQGGHKRILHLHRIFLRKDMFLSKNS